MGGGVGHGLFSFSLSASTFQRPLYVDPYRLLVHSDLLSPPLLRCSGSPISTSDLPGSSPPPPTDYVYFENSSSNPYLVRRIEELNKVSGAESRPAPQVVSFF